LDAHVAGAELNMLITASALGARGRWLTRLPENALGTMIRRHAYSNGIEVEARVEPDGRAGLFFLELGAPPRPSTVLYDRKDSAASHMDGDEFVWGDVLAGAAAAHVTGITCALGAGPFAATVAFLRCAKELGVVTSFDLNFRSHLWSADQARVHFRQVLPLVDVLFLGPRDLAMIYECDDDADTLAAKLVEEYHTSTVVIRERCEVSAQELGVRVHVAGEPGADVVASGFVVDELGAGDAAAGAFLTSLLQGETIETCTERCARAYSRMLTIPGDSWSGSSYDLTDGFFSSRKLVR
jgi:2-dehydro-3-deoxygluconokinase